MELPDGEAAWQKGPDRQEFFIEHYGAYSLEACAVLARAAGLEVIALERLTEVNEKFTVRGLFRVARAR